jgi:Putative DNA-binding domain
VKPVPELAQLQKRIRESIHAQKMVPELDTEIVSDHIAAPQRLQVYQNNYHGTLIEALLGVFPIVSAFVGEVFTRQALKHFIECDPPRDVCLSEYGASFPEFLDAYNHAADVPYVGDIARLEWAVHSLQHALEKSHQSVSVGELRLNENVVFLESDYPLLNLWMVGTGRMVPEAVHIQQGGQDICVVLHAGQIELFTISEAEQKSLAQLQGGEGGMTDLAIETLRLKNIVVKTDFTGG